MFELLSDKLSSLFARFRTEKKITLSDVNSIIEQVQDSLLHADVPYDLVQEFAHTIKNDAIGRKIHEALQPSEQLMKIVQDAMVTFMGAEEATFSFQIPSVVLVMGLQGSGKTTTISKLVYYVKKQAELKKKVRRILVASVDYYRPAAIDQLEQLSHAVGADFYRAQSKDPVEATHEIYQRYKQQGYEHLFLDTAGRMHVDEKMVQELKQIAQIVQPKYTFLVLDAMTGQESLQIAHMFNQQVPFSGAILTKMDSDTRGGAAFSFRYRLKKPIVFVGTGEKAENLDQFFPKRAISRMLGMGDLQTLAEKADQKIQKADQEKMYRQLGKGMTLDDFAQQLEAIRSMGSLVSLSKYMPNMGGQVSAGMLEQGEVELKKFRAILGSMTRKERLIPSVLDASRKKRIAFGAGVGVTDINLLLNRFEQMQQYGKLIKKFGLYK